MSETVIQIENLSKYYRLGLIGGRTLRDDLERKWAKLRGKPDPLLIIGQEDHGNVEGEFIWALRDICLDVKQSEILGIIGKNGAGKTTLLKILSKITAPTKGRALVKGRIASLLEVGTGFHGELTGRENIYLNGAILGMTKQEITRKLDEIIDFSGVELYIDTPVKRYSSGMYVRLAFAVAAHLEPEILLVDEVLAVGDAEFQKKCLGKMGEVSKGGRTVLFVSHNMSSITRLCERAILLGSGRIIEDGPAENVVSTYLQSGMGITAERKWENLEEAPGNDFVRMRSVRVVNSDRHTIDNADIRQPVGIEIEFEIFEQRLKFVPMIALFNEMGILVFNAMDTDPAWHEPRKSGLYTCIAWIPGNILSEGRMSITVLLSTHSPSRAIRQAHINDVVAFQIEDPIEGDSARGNYVGGWGGAVRPLLHWTTECVERENAL